MSNCREGDLARIVHPDDYGRLVLVRQRITSAPHFFPDGWQASQDSLGLWEIECLGWRYRGQRFTGARYVAADLQWGACEDKWLRPIRDPGDDAVDETLQRVRKPDSTPIEFALQIER